MSGVRAALFWSLTERYLLIVLALASNIILARLLTPEEVGIYSVSLAVIGVAQVLRDFGIGNFLIQERELTEIKVRTAFGLSLVIGVSLFILLYITAPALAQFYSEPRLAATLQLVAVNFLTLPFCTVSLSLLRRQMRFRAVMVGALLSAVLGFVVTVGAAGFGFGPNSLAIGSIVSNLTTGVAAWICHKPRQFIYPSLRAWRDLLAFGGQSTLTGVVNAFAMDANDIVVAKILGFNAVAILSRAQSLMSLFNRDLMSAVRNVALPAYSRARREDQDIDIQNTHATAIVTVLGWSFYGLVSIFSLEALRILYGPQWDAAAELVPWFCLAGAISALNALVPTLLIASGNIRITVRAELIVQPVRLALLVGAVSIWKSPLACALAYVAATAIGVPYYLLLKQRAIPTNWRCWLPSQGKSLMISLLCVSPSLLLQFLNPPEPGMTQNPLSVAGACVAGICIAIPMVVWLRHPLANEAAFLRVASLLGIRSSSAGTSGKRT